MSHNTVNCFNEQSCELPPQALLWRQDRTCSSLGQFCSQLECFTLAPRPSLALFQNSSPMWHRNREARRERPGSDVSLKTWTFLGQLYPRGQLVLCRVDAWGRSYGCQTQRRQSTSMNQVVLYFSCTDVQALSCQPQTLQQGLSLSFGRTAQSFADLH
mgnify:CR=1 FL=1